LQNNRIRECCLIKALFLRNNFQLSLEETPQPVISKPGDIIVRVTASSICGSDIHFVTGEVPLKPDFIIGHEGVGVVEEVGTGVEFFKPGDRVVIPYMVSCGYCSECKAGRAYACLADLQFGVGKARGDLPGTQAEFVRIPFADSSVVPIPDSVTDREALFVGDILSTGYFGVTNGNIQPGDEVAVFGAGPVGLCAVACAKLFSPSKIILVDLEDYRLEAGIRLGATHTINARSTRAGSEIRRLTGGTGVQVSIEASGAEAALDDCLACTAKGGILSAIGMTPFSVKFTMGKMFYKNLTMISGYTTLNEMRRLVKLIECKQLDLTSLITHEVPFSSILEGYRIFQNRLDDCIKVMVVPD
jgi:alcohol dehydrogenase